MRRPSAVLAITLAVVFSLGWLATRPANAGGTAATVRVGLAREVSEATVGAREQALIYDSTGAFLGLLPGETTLGSGPGGKIVVPGLGSFAGPLVVRAAVGETSSGFPLVTVAGRPYRGELEVLVRGSSLTVVNVVDLEDYLLGVVPREMPGSFPAEALKAQAVAARTYALSTRAGKAYAALGYDLVPTTACQVYGGREAECESTTAAVRATEGEVITYRGALIGAFFHSTSGGHTESVEFVWGYPSPYLKGVPDLDQDSHHYSWSVAFEAVELGLRLEAAGYGVGQVIELRGDGPQGPGGRYLDYLVVGSGGTVRLRSEKLRSVLGLKSTRFEVVAQKERTENVVRSLAAEGSLAVGAGGVAGPVAAGDLVALGVGYAYPLHSPELWAVSAIRLPAGFTLDGHGWGHGVGMSQWGARGLALAGRDYRDILTHYYSGVTLETLP